MASFQTLQELREEVERRIGALESTKLKPSMEEEVDSVRDVLHEFNRLKPQVFVNEVAGDGTQRRFVLATEITGSVSWDDDVSELLELSLVESPDTDDESVKIFEDTHWEIRRSAADELVLFVLTAAGSGQFLRFTWSLPHTVQDLDAATATTITEKGKAVLVLLVAAEFSELISRKASDLADHTLGVDQVDFQSYEQRWKDNAKRLHERAEERLRPSDLTLGGSGMATEWETRNRFGLRRLTHGGFAQ